MPSLVVVLQEETGHEGEPGKHVAAVVCLNELLLQTSGEVISANDQALILGVMDGVPSSSVQINVAYTKWYK